MSKNNNLQTEVAPLEQHEKNLECDGVHYKVVKEDPNGKQKNVSRE